MVFIQFKRHLLHYSRFKLTLKFYVYRSAAKGQSPQLLFAYHKYYFLAGSRLTTTRARELLAP